MLKLGRYPPQKIQSSHLKHDLLKSQLIVKGYLENREDLLTLLCASNLVIIPSRTEGLGLTALEALSAGIPFLVSQNSGFGEALQEIPRGSAFGSLTVSGNGVIFLPTLKNKEIHAKAPQDSTRTFRLHFMTLRG